MSASSVPGSSHQGKRVWTELSGLMEAELSLLREENQRLQREISDARLELSSARDKVWDPSCFQITLMQRLKCGPWPSSVLEYMWRNHVILPDSASMPPVTLGGALKYFFLPRGEWWKIIENHRSNAVPELVNITTVVQARQLEALVLSVKQQKQLNQASLAKTAEQERSALKREIEALQTQLHNKVMDCTGARCINTLYVEVGCSSWAEKTDERTIHAV